VQRSFANWNVIRHLSGPPWPYPEDGAISHITETVLPASAAGTSLTWAITLRDHNDELVGCIDFAFEDTGLGNRGFWLAEHLWGQGYMTEAVTAVQDHVLLDLGIERMTALNSVSNAASRRIKEKTGVRFLGQIRVPHNNGESVSDKWEITRSDCAHIRGMTEA
jgi:ribosomal-protein-alanine N-acetyltransferase